jgi:predicted tellurium resistance membrane protein TerC
VVAVLVMLFAVNGISNFVEEHPTVKMLALSFLLLIGFSLIAEAFELHIPKGYIYFAMAFSVFVELINLRLRTPAQAPVKLRAGYVEAENEKA